MAITSEINVTPSFTFDTLQFGNEVLNAVITATLTAFIIANIGSIVSKLVYFTRRKNFRYQSWVRSYIFSNSDDPIRIISWLFGRYGYHNKGWARAQHHLKPSRLIIPLLARAIIFITSIASIAINVPGEKKMPRCGNFDFRPVWNASAARSSESAKSVCLDIPLESRIGNVRTSASYCHCSFSKFHEGEQGITEVIVSRRIDSGVVRTGVRNATSFVGTDFYIEWKIGKGEESVFRSDVSNLDLETHSKLAINASQELRPDCKLLSNRTTPAADIVSTLNCNVDVDIVAMRDYMEPYIRNGLVWEKRLETQRRLVVFNDSISEFNGECPIEVIVTRPLVNILLLVLILVGMVAINVVVSHILSQHGNVLDASFHLIKDTLGLDCTLNPLQTNPDLAEETELHLQCWRCTSGGGHYSFIGREGDEPVTTFDATTALGGCAIARSDITRMEGP